MIPNHLKFHRLKNMVSIEQVLAHRGLLTKMRASPHTLVGPCPIHHGDSPRAFVVSRTKNLWRCFTACDSGGDVVELVRRLDHCSYPQVAYYLNSLANWFPPAHPPFQKSHSNSFTPFPHRLRLDADVDFFRQKAIEPDVAYHFESGAYRERGFLRGCIGVRLHDPEGQPLGYAGRRLDPHDVQHFGKWKFPPRLPKKQLLYNFHRVKPLRPPTLVIVEDPWSVMRLHQIKVPAVALLGAHLFPEQRCLLLDSPLLVLMLDADDTGRKAARRIHQQMQIYTTVRIASLPDGKDPDDLTDEQLVRILRPFGL